jgi:hypothetical protein
MPGARRRLKNAPRAPVLIELLWDGCEFDNVDFLLVA